MTLEADGRMRLTILGGFLGSGKTTWLRHQLHENPMRGTLVVVNEVAAVSVDDTLLFRSAQLATLPGGCACCDGKQDFLRLMRDVAEQRVDASSSPEDRVDTIILETSGLSDPASIVDALGIDPVLVHHVVIREVVVVVDAVNGLAQFRSEPLSRRQVEAADRLIVTKVDVVAEPELRRLLATLRSLNPGAAISGSALGSPCRLPDAGQDEAEELPTLDGVQKAPVVATTLRLDDAIDWSAFTVWLSALLHARGDDFLRVKGVVPTPAGRLLLQCVGRVVQAPEILPGGMENIAGVDNEVVVIGRNFDPRDLPVSLRRFVGLKPEAPAAPRNGDPDRGLSSFSANATGSG